MTDNLMQAQAHRAQRQRQRQRQRQKGLVNQSVASQYLLHAYKCGAKEQKLYQRVILVGPTP